MATFDFAHPVERELARLYDEHGIAWEYEPHTFVLERDAEGRVREAFTPDFFLPELGVYVECTVMRQCWTTRKRRKARKVRNRAGVTVGISTGGTSSSLLGGGGCAGLLGPPQPTKAGLDATGRGYAYCARCANR